MSSVLVLEQRFRASSRKADLLLPLSAEQRTVMRGRRRTACGQEVLLQLPRGGVLQPGDQLGDSAGTVRVEVMAAAEMLLRVQASSPLQLMQAAYHLGNRHVALELQEQDLFLLDDSVLAAMLTSRGLQLTPCTRPFAPEGGAYEAHRHG